ncbi:fatty acid--CoA ligase family protein [Barrientosiimonas marina]|uniref:Class I adenylate-forming enzyme family protein n=1 Tax=Lentibacillus kimchii TaxID=1542911 RepID=A0ABW2UX83_9BACI
MLLSKLLEENINSYGEYPLLYYGNKSYTNAESELMAKKVSCLIDKLGIEVGDRVLVCMPNSPEVIFSYQGILRSGAIVVPVMHLLQADEINYILENSQAKAIVTSSFLLDKVIEATKGLQIKPKIICVDLPNDETSSDQTIDMMDWQNSLSKINTSEEHSPNLKEDDVAVIFYTSGTTGKPKGVMLTHKNLHANASNGVLLREHEERGTTLGILPLAHIFGFGVMNDLFIKGESVVIIPKFETEEVFKAIEKYNVKSFALVPAMIHAMVTNPKADKYDLTSLETVTSGSAALPASLRETFFEKFQAEVWDAYGLSEASPGVATQRHELPIKEGSAGVPMPGVTIKIADEDGTELPTGEVGELLVRGDNVTPGYFKNEAATKQALRNGWLYTGDMAVVDEEGYLYIVDRKKDLIIRGGFNIYPHDLEELLSKHEAVSEVAVIGVPSVSMGEDVLACVVKKEDYNITEKALIEYCQLHLAKYKTPRQIVFVKDLPRNGVGKILKMRLKDMYQEFQF